ncbi:MAG: hypothetical protein LBV34_13025, partial [Nocardiopsaceae bacterium]|nr:hypothetical protein [Nocardiopsaceae bacterium]
AGIVADEPVRSDTEGLGWLLYAALTGYWPGPEYPPLPPAPLVAGEPRSPRQVIAGIPLTLSEICDRAMDLMPPEDSPLTAPGELAKALLATLPPTPLLAAAPPPPRRERSDYDREDGWPRTDQPVPESWPRGPGYDDTAWPADGYSYQPQHGPRRGGPGGSGFLTTRAAKAVFAGVAVLAVVGVAAFMLWPTGAAPKGHPRPNRSTPLTSVTQLTPAGAQGFDPLTSVALDPGNEKTQDAKYAIDGSMSTSWTSQWSQTAAFGNLKAGSGLMIDMGHKVRFSSVTVTFNSEPGAEVELKVGDSSDRSKQNLDNMTTVASATNPMGKHPFQFTSQVTGRYLVIWFTKLPPMPDSSGRYEAQVFNVTIRGTSSSQ